jgi:hypothetical protein
MKNQVTEILSKTGLNNIIVVAGREYDIQSSYGLAKGYGLARLYSGNDYVIISNGNGIDELLVSNSLNAGKGTSIVVFATTKAKAEAVLRVINSDEIKVKFQVIAVLEGASKAAKTIAMGVVGEIIRRADVQLISSPEGLYSGISQGQSIDLEAELNTSVDIEPIISGNTVEEAIIANVVSEDTNGNKGVASEASETPASVAEAPVMIEEPIEAPVIEEIASNEVTASDKPKVKPSVASAKRKPKRSSVNKRNVAASAVEPTLASIGISILIYLSLKLTKALTSYTVIARVITAAIASIPGKVSLSIKLNLSILLTLIIKFLMKLNKKLQPNVDPASVVTSVITPEPTPNPTKPTHKPVTTPAITTAVEPSKEAIAAAIAAGTLTQDDIVWETEIGTIAPDGLGIGCDAIVNKRTLLTFMMNQRKSVYLTCSQDIIDAGYTDCGHAKLVYLDGHKKDKWGRVIESELDELDLSVFKSESRGWDERKEDTRIAYQELREMYEAVRKANPAIPSIGFDCGVGNTGLFTYKFINRKHTPVLVPDSKYAYIMSEPTIFLSERGIGYEPHVKKSNLFPELNKVYLGSKCKIYGVSI